MNCKRCCLKKKKPTTTINVHKDWAWIKKLKISLYNKLDLLLRIKWPTHLPRYIIHVAVNLIIKIRRGDYLTRTIIDIKRIGWGKHVNPCTAHVVIVIIIQCGMFVCKWVFDSQLLLPEPWRNTEFDIFSIKIQMSLLLVFLVRWRRTPIFSR